MHKTNIIPTEERNYIKNENAIKNKIALNNFNKYSQGLKFRENLSQMLARQSSSNVKGAPKGSPSASSPYRVVTN